MTPRFDLVGLVVADMPASLAFYRTLGLDIPSSADTEPHVEIALPGGIRRAEFVTAVPEARWTRSASR